ncbi:outer membrane protein transport protein [candidate division KSB1 bacterium]|nr:outer membrane protein transport protein [candidate division KSB1 bacterium]
MKYFILALLACASIAVAQDQIPERLLLTTGQYLGPGARAMGLGGTYTGIADDYSAIWWNPAGLAQVKRIELQGSLSRTSFKNETDYFGSSLDGSTSSLRLNDMGVVFPVPVYQGAMSFGIGYSQVLAFDRRTRVESPVDSNADWDDFDELESGRLGLWSFAGAVDVSPNLALGLGLNYWSGGDEYTLTGHYTDADSRIYSEQSITTDLSGIGANVGGLFRIGRTGRVGAMFHSPISMSLKEDWIIEGASGYDNYRMSYPAVFRLGGSISPGRWLVAADLEYRDWTSLSFRSDTPYRDVSKAEANQQIKDQYKSTTRLSFGGEYLFPAYGLRGRAGLSFAPTNYRASGGDDDKTILTLGLGILVDRSVMLDATYHFSSYTEQVTTGLTEDIRSNAALFTLSYRL